METLKYSSFMQLFTSPNSSINFDKKGLFAGLQKVGYLALVFCFSICTALASKAEVVHYTDASVLGLPHSHLNLWKDDSEKPKGVIIAMHGLIMHGGVYDKLARRLVNQGYIVYAADMRGYGRWNPSLVKEILANKRKSDGYTTSDLGVRVSSGSVSQEYLQVNSAFTNKRTEQKESKKFLTERSKVVYSESFKDLLKLTRTIRENHRDLPLFLVGESMGAGMAIHVASEAPDCVDGLVLSSPAIKKKINIAPRMIVDALKVVVHPKSPLNLKPYILRFSSEDPEIAHCCANDPLVRKSLSLKELYRTAKEINRNIKYADTVPSDIPVLVIQGDKDRMVKSNGAALLLTHLKSKDQTVKWFGGRGHLLLETPLITEDTMNVVQEWINQHYMESMSRIPLKSASIQ